jgi:raffinose/stachyose/melibiose transport system permease protein
VPAATGGARFGTRGGEILAGTTKTLMVSQRRSDYMWGALFVIPSVVLILALKYFPLFLGIFNSLQEWKGSEPHWVGLANYGRMLADPMAQQTFLNALKIALTLPVWILLPMVVAFLVYQRTPGWQFFRVVYFLPYTISPIIVGLIWRQILHQQGPVNALLAAVGLGGLAHSWLGDKNFVLWTVDAVVLWSIFGFGIVTYLAGLATIDEEIFDAAAIDGAGFWRRLRRIVVPLLRPVMGYWAVICTAGMLVWMFPYLHSMTQGGPGFASMLPDYLVYMVAFKFMEPGYGTTIGLVLFVFVAIISGFQVRYMYLSGAEKKGRKR